MQKNTHLIPLKKFSGKIFRIFSRSSLRLRILSLFLLIITLAITSVSAITYTIGKNNVEHTTRKQLENSVEFVKSQISVLTEAYNSKQFPEKLNHLMSREINNLNQSNYEGYIYLIDSSHNEIDPSSSSSSTDKKTILPDNFIIQAFKDKAGCTDLTINGKPSLVSYEYIVEKDWLFVKIVTKESYLGFIYKLQNICILTGIISVILAFIIIFLGTKGMLRSINELSKVISLCGKGNLTVRTRIMRGGSELQKLSNNFNTMLSSMENMFIQISASIEELSITSQKLTNISENADKSTSNIYSSTQEMVSFSENQKIYIDEINTSANKLINISSNIAKQISNTFEASKEMILTVNKGIVNMSRLNDKMTAICSSSEETMNHITILDKYTDEINKITSSIKSISSQTKLLSLNASIEAARAGEAGKGFSVVAGEIQKLAHDSSISVSEVEKIIAQIKNSTDIVVNKAGTGMELALEGADIASVTNNTLNNIMNKVTETNDYIKQLSINSDTVTRGVSSFISSTNNILEDVNNIASRVQQIGAEVDTHNDLSSSIIENADIIKNIVEKLNAQKNYFQTSNKNTA